MFDVSIKWKSQSNTEWNKTCATVIKHFGLPGGKYISQASEDCLTFKFNQEHDAFMCKLLISEAL